MQHRLFSLLLELCYLDSVSRNLPNLLSDFHGFSTKFIRVHCLYRISSILRQHNFFLISETLRLIFDSRSQFNGFVFFFLTVHKIVWLQSVASWNQWFSVPGSFQYLIDGNEA